MLLRVLRMAGAEACAVPDSAQALGALEDWHPDVLLSDAGLGEDGYVLLPDSPRNRDIINALPSDGGVNVEVDAAAVGPLP